jgi:negative regulator of flagellin synthesis FlgM
MKVTDKTSAEHADGAQKTHSTKRKSHTTSASHPEKISSSDEMGSAKVKLSDRAQDMKKIRAAVDASPDVDEAKVQKFKSMLAKGEYKVDSKAVADKMVDEHAYNEFFNTEE